MKKTKILIVEDETIIALNIKNILLNLGYEVPAIASTADEAIEKTSELHPDIVLMDIKLKEGGEGIEVADTIRSRFAIPVIYLTAYANGETLDKAKTTMPYGYIMKPPDVRTLQGTIEMAIYKHTMEKELKKHLEGLMEERTRELRVCTEELRRDISMRLKAEEDLRESLASIKRAFQGTITALAKIGEFIGLYTKGHQERVARLSSAIARELHLPEEKVEAIHVMGLLHDIGKMVVPKDILSKPATLTEIEWSIIKTHPQVGYDIVKEIEFPFGVAKAVLMHHERINGSGYPMGLTGKDIPSEAKILALAEVVDAMSSHQLYRPALGIDAALEEIEKNRGVLYDADVVDICLELFRKKGFSFE